ncbi:hypothetical protein BDZ45DRAFT_602030 [Acephala macrosclerotiorum]|nr:hypothetical protein BDZ45DRAFT_602030 [Acephala macrosclerotiorum]
MFLTEQGYLGLGQEGVRKGDIVCVFCGGDVPFLLRKSEKTPSKALPLLYRPLSHVGLFI